MSIYNYSPGHSDFNVTPRKRKRHDIFEEQENIPTTAASTSCFTNAAFCSTPKKILGKRRSQLNKNNENKKIFSNKRNEEKLIPASLKSYEETTNIPQNPFEVLRKPPKKKKRHAEESACFENPALNLDHPEKVLNPFEVIRTIPEDEYSNCFSNPALNLKVQDASILCNPFEVQRQAPCHESDSLKTPLPKNPFLTSPEVDKQLEELPPKPGQLTLGLPFTPKIGCRIDFKNVPISQLTPSKLLAEKLVFSPVQKPKLSLDSIAEESSMDIGRELDRYQLELENSINEAKLRKTGETKENVTIITPPDSNCKTKITHLDQKKKFTKKLCDISEDGENIQIIKTSMKIETTIELNSQKEENTNKIEKHVETKLLTNDLIEQYEKTETAEVISIENLDDLYGTSADENEDSFDFKAPTTFVRAYTRPKPANLVVSKKPSEPGTQENFVEKESDPKKPLNVKNIIRKSIRKLMPNHQHDNQTEKDFYTESEPEKQKGFMDAIRHSFRKKTSKNADNIEPLTRNEISIIDCSERTMKLKSDGFAIEELEKESKKNIRKSVRKSVREVRNQFLKTVFQKDHEEYVFKE